MYRLYPLLLATLLPCFLLAQKDKDIPAFGKVEKQDLLLKDCEFDKNAEAMVMFDVAELYCIFNANSVSYPLGTEIERHIRIKVLNDKGLESADIKIPYTHYKNSTSIKNITAQTYNIDADGNVVVSKLDKKNIYNKKVDSRRSHMIFTLPEVKAGSVIEYKYTFTGSGIITPDEWHFQRHIPVMLSRLVVNFPSEFEVHCEQSNVLPIEFAKEMKSTRNIQTYTMKNIPALRDEPFISCESDYVQKVMPKIIAYNSPMKRHSFVYSWPQIIRALMEDEDFGLQLKKNIPRTKDLDDSLKNITDPYTRMKVIHNYVRNNMEWNGYSNIWAMEGVKSAWTSKKGTSGEINLILVNLLKDAGLKAHALLVSSRENGRVNTGMADPSQFNKVLAHVVIDGRAYVLDGTDKITPSGLIPYDVMYTEGLVIEKPETYEWGWITLWDEKKLYRDVIVVNAAVTPEGELAGTATISSFDYARVEKLNRLKDGRSAILQQYVSPLPQITADSLILENDKHDSLPLIQKIPFKQKLNSTGDYQYFSVNMFTGLENNPFVADTRFSDVFFSTNRHFQMVSAITIPDEYTFDELPKSVRMLTPDSSVVLIRRIASSGNQLSSRITVEIKKPYFSTEEYDDFREFYKKMVGILNEQFVIKKKATPQPLP